MNTVKRPLEFASYVDWPATALPFEDFEGEFTAYFDEPFGEEIINPAKRVIPSHFWGTWVPHYATGKLSDSGEPNEYWLFQEAYLKMQGSWRSFQYPKQPVVAVRTIAENKIAIVSQDPEPDGGPWRYSLVMVGLSKDRTRLYDLESADVTYYHVDAIAGPMGHVRYDLDDD